MGQHRFLLLLPFVVSLFVGASQADATMLKQLSMMHAAIGSDLPLDHFMSYKAKFKALDDPKGKFFKFSPLVLTSQFGEAKYEVVKPKALLLPADKNGEGVADENTHLEEYQIKRVNKLSNGSTQAKFAKLQDIRIDNQCTSVSTFLELLKEESLLLPTNKDPNALAPPVDENAHALDHFLCYKVKQQTKMGAAKLPKFPKGTQVSATDQFQSRIYDLKKITKLCAPTEKEEDPNDPILIGSGPNKGDPRAIEPAWVRNPNAHLVCYQAKPAKKLISQAGCGCDTALDPKCKGTTIDPKQPKHVARTGFANNQFGPESFEKTKENEFCIPTFKHPAVVSQTLDIPSEAEPDETPGSSGVIVDPNSSVAAQLGTGADLNNARYTRYFAANALSSQPDAILILIPGFEGGAGSFKILAENLVTRALVQDKLTLEVWGLDRRSNQLEDLEGLNISEDNLDPLIGLDWLFGAELGLTLDSKLAAGPNRRAIFHNATDDVPFIANWTVLTHSQDIDAVVEQARSEAKNQNVFLGGHSAGTGFTARYAATDFDLTGGGPVEAGYAKLRGLVLLEGGGGSSSGSAPSSDDLDRIEDRFDGGLFAAVRDQAPRCVDGTPCTVANEAVDCAGKGKEKCIEEEFAYAIVPGLLNPRVLASGGPTAVQAILDPDTGHGILGVDQGAPGNNAIDVVPDLAALGFLPPATAFGGLGDFLDDDGLVASLFSFVATSVGLPDPIDPNDTLQNWIDITEDVPASAFTDNGPPPTSLASADVWGVEQEATRLDRMATTFIGNTNFTDWYYPSSGLGVTSGLPSLDTSALSVGRSRRDIANTTQAANIDIPVISFGGSNGLTPVPGSFVAFGQSIGLCAAASCDGTARVVDPNAPNTAFPSLGEVAGGFEAHISEGYAHVDIVTAEDDAGNNVIRPLIDFIERNLQ